MMTGRKKVLDLVTRDISVSGTFITDYSWPGNVRELQSAIQFALIHSKGQVIKQDHLPIELKGHESKQSVRGPSQKLDSASVHEALTRSGGNKAKAARFLGVGRATLYRFLNKFPNIAKDHFM